MPRRPVQGIRIRRFIFGDHLFPAAGVACQGKSRQTHIGAEQTVLHQGGDQGDKAGSVAAGIRDPLCKGDLLPLPGQFRHAVNPSFRCPVGGGCVDDDPVRVCYEGNSLDGGGIRQAEEGNVCAVQRVCPGGGILAKILRKDHQPEILPVRKPVTDSQSGRSGASVNKNSRHGCSPILRKYPAREMRRDDSGCHLERSREIPYFLFAASTRAWTLVGRPNRVMKPAESFWL